jgi:phytoene synthase
VEGGAVGEVMRAPGPGRGAPSTGSSFHYSFSLLPRDQRRGIEAVYAFCREIDDLADEPPPGTGEGAGRPAIERLRLYREEIGRCYGGTPALPVMRDLQECIGRFGIGRGPLLALVDGVEMDLRKARYETFGELREYCCRVASAVGLACLSIFGCRHPRSRDYAVDLGIALQLTNILRDLKADAARGRIYVPRDEIASFGYDEDLLLRGVRNGPYLALMRHQAERARRHFETAALALPSADRPRLVAAEVMAAIYRRLLRRIESGGFRVFERRYAVPRLTQIGVAFRAWCTGRPGP